MVEDRCVYAAMRLTSIEFSFDPCNIYSDGPRGVGYPADARSVGDSHPSCSKSLGIFVIEGIIKIIMIIVIIIIIIITKAKNVWQNGHAVSIPL